MDKVVDSGPRARSGGLGDRFWKLWSSNALSNLADGIVMVTMPLLAAQRTDSPALVAGITVSVYLPWLLFTLHAGVVADRSDRKRVMQLAHLARVVLLAALAAALVWDVASIWLLYVVSLTLGAGEVAFTTARGPSIPLLIERDQLVAANSRLEAAETTLNEFIGPPVGGALVGVGAIVAVAAGAGAYLVAAMALMLMAGPLRSSRPEGHGTVGADIREGFGYLWGHDLLRTLTIMVAVMAAAWAAWMSVLVLYARGPMGLSEVGYGLLLTVTAAGGLAGAVVAERLRRRFGYARLLLANVVGTTTLFAAPALTPNRWVVGAAFLVGGATGVVWNVVNAALTQTLVPNHLLGRVGAAARLVSWGTLPIGAALGGLIGEFLGLRVVFSVGAAAVVMLLTFRRTVNERVIGEYLGAAGQSQPG